MDVAPVVIVPLDVVPVVTVPLDDVPESVVPLVVVPLVVVGVAPPPVVSPKPGRPTGPVLAPATWRAGPVIPLPRRRRRQTVCPLRATSAPGYRP